MLRQARGGVGGMQAFLVRKRKSVIFEKRAVDVASSCVSRTGAFCLEEAKGHQKRTMVVGRRSC